MIPTPDWLVRHLAALGVRPGPVAVGVSGGPDSLALLHLLRAMQPGHGLDLIVAHVDHGIHPESGAVAERVARIAADAGLPILVGTLHLGPEASEAIARRERYRWFRAMLTRTGAPHLLLAHHREDQAETILMRVLAGTGPAGLAGMAAVRGPFVRPLLGVGSAALRAVLEGTGADPWQDPSNRDTRHTRGWLRSEILPLLERRDPQAVARLVQVGVQAAADRAAWTAVLEAMPALDLRAETHGVSVAAPPLSGYDSGLAHGLLRAVVRRAGAATSGRGIARLESLARRGSSGDWVPLGGRWRGELAFGRLRIVAVAPVQEALMLSLASGGSGSAGFGPWRVRWGAPEAGTELRRDGWRTRFIPGEYTIRPWRAGDRIRPVGGVGSRLVVRCMQDGRVPRSERSGWPVVLAADGNVTWVPGVCRAEAALPPDGEEGVEVEIEQS